ncbi:glycosyltransferase family 2 protein [Embleya hyalina]|uniref:Glycosyl transferase n=1 Tax=Embleya hyalina TaxID=516124 RepID=A0A401YQF2_9ACTN|nr:glycosyltransferase family 2 protein [Embleya hyalina]GCD96821.1 glycosyl transferase [Embleya hyalina]
MSRADLPTRAWDLNHPMLSVLTAVHDDAVRFLPAAAASLAEQMVPVHWIICFDGDTVPAAVRDLVDRKCRKPVPHLTLVAAGGTSGPATARTVALGRVGTPWTAVLDADDVWLPGGLDTLFETAVRTGAAWCAGRSVDLVDGRRVDFPDHLPRGPVAPGAVLEARELLGFMPFVGAAMVWRTRTLWEMGGWPALPACEDSVLILAANEVHEGYYQAGEPVYGYTKYEGQTTSLPEHAMRQRIAATHYHRRIAALRDAVRPPLGSPAGRQEVGSDG